MAIDWMKFCRRALHDVRLMCGKPVGGETPAPFPLTADGTKVPVEVSGLELGDVSIEFPETQNIVGSVAVTNFPAAPAFPSSIEVSNFPQAGTCLTDGELRAAPLSVAVTNHPAPLTSIQVSNFPAPVTSLEVSNFPDPPAVQEVSGIVGAVCSGTVSVSNFPAFPSSFQVSNFPAFPVSQAVTGAFYPETQPVSGTVNATCSGTVNVGNFPVLQAVTGTFWQATQPVSGPLTDVQLRATPLPVSGSINATCSGTVAVSNFPVTQPVSGPLTDAQLRASAVPVTGSFSSAPQPSTLCVSQTASISQAVTATLPVAGAGLFHYITAIEITSYAGATIATAAGAVTITTTNLPGNPVFNHQRLHTAGQSFKSGLALAGSPLRSAVANTTTTVVCPVLTGCIWRVNVTYYTAP